MRCQSLTFVCRSFNRAFGRGLVLAAAIVSSRMAASSARGDEPAGIQSFRREVEPILAEFCFGCHGNGMSTANVAFDAFASDQALLQDRELWWKALKQLRAGLMPPREEAKPSAEQVGTIEKWIKSAVFEIDPADPDPGRVTVRRLNRVEYRNTIRELMGIEFDTNVEFPADDSGHGFDNIGDVLTISPLLLEKYLAASKSIVGRAVPTVSRVVPEKTIEGKAFTRIDDRDDNDDEPAPPTGDDQGKETDKPKDDKAKDETAKESVKDKAPANGDAKAGKKRKKRDDRPELIFSYYEPASATVQHSVEHTGKYELVVNLTANEKFVDGVIDYNKCELVFRVDGRELLRKEFSRHDGKAFHFEVEQEWAAGEHELAFDVKPLTPDEPQGRSLSLRIVSVVVRGPHDPQYGVRPANYERFFGRDVPEDAAGRHQRAGEVLAQFAAKAFRRPVETDTVERLVAIAETVAARPGQTYESGIAGAMTAVLASPRFLYREEAADPGPAGKYLLLDEYALASRLSYFLWSSMPDEELFRLAADHNLRESLPAQVKRMLADSRSNELVRNFVGQWLQSRDIETVIIDAQAVILRDRQPDPDSERRRDRFRELRRKPLEDLTEAEKAEIDAARKAFVDARKKFRQFELDGDLRRAMRRETEMLFEHILREDRSLLELIDCDYTFLNERLAKHYGIDDVKGDKMRLVQLPPESPRGGILTQGTVLAITSNPNRTSPVKRGLFILDNLLGSPPPPPPPNIPPLEDAGKQVAGRTPGLRETLELHRTKALCNSCHNRMDPLGLALENFNALGVFREKERDIDIDPSGTLLSGESFANVRELKHVLAGPRRLDFYRCLAEKMLTYALGRGLDYYDVHTVDTIVERLEASGGRPSVLIEGVIESAAFQKSRREAEDTK